MTALAYNGYLLRLGLDDVKQDRSMVLSVPSTRWMRSCDGREQFLCAPWPSSINHTDQGTEPWDCLIHLQGTK